MTAAETQGPCEGCQQTATLIRYQPDHTHWYEPDSFTCRWCMRFPQPFLCADCTKDEAAEEKGGRPTSVGEQRVVGFLVRGAALDKQERWAS